MKLDLVRRTLILSEGRCGAATGLLAPASGGDRGTQSGSCLAARAVRPGQNPKLVQNQFCACGELGANPSLYG